MSNSFLGTKLGFFPFICWQVIKIVLIIFVRSNHFYFVFISASSRPISEIEEDIVDSDDDSIVIGGSTANLRMSSSHGSRPTSG